MKNITVLILLFFISEFTFAQSENQNNKLYSKNDTLPKVIYQVNIERPLIDVNGKLYTVEVMSRLINEDIESMDVIEGKFEHLGDTYRGKIIIKTKSVFNPNLITLNQLLSKYTTLKKTDKYIYKIDGKIVNSDEDTTLVDENNIMQIKVVKLDKIKNIENMNFIEILTRTEKKLYKGNQIILRGSEITMN